VAGRLIVYYGERLLLCLESLKTTFLSYTGFYGLASGLLLIL
jgi:hypothetical protein